MYGIKVDYDKYHDIEENDMVVADGMNGEYVVIGKVIFKSEDGRYDDASIPFMEILPLLSEEYQKIREYATRLGVVGDIKLYAFTRYS